VDAHIDPTGVQRLRPWAGRGRALALAAVLSLVLVLLASAVFSIAGRSREVARRSVELHSLNESIRAATVVRAQVTFAAYLATNDASNGTDSHLEIGVATREARRNLTDLETTFDTVPSDETLDQETRTALARFTHAAGRTLEVTASSRPAGARLLVRDRLVPSFAVLRDRLVSRRDKALADVKHAGSLLGRLGGLASFVIAFVLPTVAVLVYRQITRRSRESIELATALARERGRGKRRQRLLAQTLARLHGELAGVEAVSTETRLAVVRRIGWHLEALLTVTAGTRQLAFAEVSLADELAALGDALPETGVDVHVTTAEGALWTDPAVLGTAVRNLVLEAQAAGAQRIDLAASVSGDHVEIRVAHDGAELAPVLAELVFDRKHDAERAAVEAGAAPIRLLAAQELIESLGGSLIPVSVSGRPAFVIRFPGAAERHERPPAVEAVASAHA
jgi:hypothetical protein